MIRQISFLAGISLAASFLSAGKSDAASLPDTTIPQSCSVQLKGDCCTAEDLDKVKELGVKFFRRGFIWEAVEKEKGVYDFSGYDVLMDNAKERGLGVIACMAFSNKLYGHVKDPAGRAGYAKFAAALAEHYKGYNVMFEIWNEPNTMTFWGRHGKKGNTEQYALEYIALVKEVVPAMRKADPNCTIIGGSTSGIWKDSYEWMNFCFKNGVLKTGIDAWSIHPYSCKTPEYYIEGYGKVRKMMADNGGPADFPMLNTERGFPIGKAEGYAGGDPKQSYEYQAWHFVRQYMIDLLCGMKLTSWYEWSGKEGFNLIKNGEPTQAYKAGKFMIEKMTGFKLSKRLPLESQQDFVLLFENAEGGQTLVAWTSPPTDQSPDKTVNHAIDLPVEVSGAGPAGFGAALAAARTGAKTLLLERNTCVGGLAASGLLGFWGPLDNAARNKCDWERFRCDRDGREYTGKLKIGQRILGGIPAELISRLEKLGGAYVPKFGFTETDVETTKFAMEQMLLDAGVKIIFQAQVVAASYVKGLPVLTVALKEGLRNFSAKTVVDATGDGDVAFQLGAEWKQGRDSDGKCQGVTLVFRIGNVRTDYLDFLPDTELSRNVSAAAEKASRSGEISFSLKGLGCLSRDPSFNGNFIVNQQHTFDIDGTKSEDLTRALINGRRQIRELVSFFKKHVPGCEGCYLIDSGFQLGVRETRRITGDYVITGEDVTGGRKFEDGICRNANFLDIHLPKDAGRKPGPKKTWYEDAKEVRPGDWQDLPYRALLPRGLENILVAGRCISGTHEAMSSYRLMPTCVGLGEAAGTAAALALEEEQTPRRLDVSKLRDRLRKNNCMI